MVMGFVWAAMLLTSVIAAVCRHSLGVLTPAAMEGAQSAITLCVSLGGALCLWSGVARVMEHIGWIDRFGKWMRPIFRRLFPSTGRDAAALGYLTANVTANLLGLGNAATPMGIAAIKRMQTLSRTKTATDEMCLLIIMNTASIQLLPTTVAAVRASFGAASPFDILPAVWITSVLSVSAGLLAAKILRRFYRG